MSPSNCARAASAQPASVIPRSHRLPDGVLRALRSGGAIALVVVTVAGTLALVAIPFGWILLAGTLSETLSLPPLAGMGAVLIGIPTSMIAGIKLLLQVNEAYEQLRGHDGPVGRVAPVWRRGLTDTRHPRRLRMLDVVLVTLVGGAVLSLCIWFVASSGSSVGL